MEESIVHVVTLMLPVKSLSRPLLAWSTRRRVSKLSGCIAALPSRRITLLLFKTEEDALRGQSECKALDLPVSRTLYIASYQRLVEASKVMPVKTGKAM